MKKDGQFISKSLKKSELVFTSEAMLKLNEEHRRCDIDYQTAQTALVNQVCLVAASYIPVLDQLADFLAELDVLAAFAIICSQNGICGTAYCRPDLINPKDEDSERRMSISEGTHPLVLENAKKFIPNDCEMLESKGRLQIITGPNMGGKSTYIRQVAISALLCQIGMFVPAARATMPIFSSIM